MDEGTLAIINRIDERVYSIAQDVAVLKEAHANSRWKERFRWALAAVIGALAGFFGYHVPGLNLHR